MGVPLLAVGASAQLVGGLIGGAKRKKAARALARRLQLAVAETQKANAERLSGIKDAFKGSFSQLSGMEDLDIDTTFADKAYDDALRSSKAQFGRSAGEEIARDTVRQQSADYIGQARGTTGSAADILGFLADTQQREMSAMQQIDFQSIQQRESRIQKAMDRLQSAGARKQDFYLGKETAEFDASRAKSMALADLAQTSGLTISNAEYENAQALIAAKNAAAQGQAGVSQIGASTWEGVLGGLGSTLTKFSLGDAENQSLFEAFGLGGGSDSKSDYENDQEMGIEYG